MQSLGHLFNEVLQERPQQLAIIDTGGDSVRTATYAELDESLERIANAAVSAGLKPGDRVGIALGNGLDFVLVVFGLSRAGIVPALFNPRLSQRDMQFMIDDAGCRIVLSDDLSFEAVAACNFNATHLTFARAASGAKPFEAWLLQSSGTQNSFLADENDVALQLYTSGSTGRPKGVTLPHLGQIRHFLDQRAFYDQVYTKVPVALIAAPMFHKNGTGTVKTSFANGGTVVIMPRFNPREFIENIEKYKVTTFSAVAAMLSAIMDQEDLIETTDFSSLDVFMVGSAPSGSILLDKAVETFGVRAFHMFGTTECGAVLGHTPERIYTLDSCGKPLPGVTVKLVDADTGKERSEYGELYVQSPGLSLGYHNRPDAQSARFKDGWYATGDILRKDDQGYFFFRGRIDDMFNCGGENVYPREVERQLLNHPDIVQAFVGPIAHRTKGQAPAAAIVTNGKSLCTEDIQSFYVGLAPAYSMPRHIVFVDSFPIAPTGKIDGVKVQSLIEQSVSRET
ncbi:MAG: class I adenylate-forming enzyme family protein [Parvibaculaceae bacterium]